MTRFLNVNMVNDDKLTEKLIGLMIKVHRQLGPGLFESVYEEAISYELLKNRISFERQKVIGVNYEEIKLELGFKADLIVENKVIIEIKSVESIKNVHIKQLVTYLKLSSIEKGLLVNFNEAYLKDGIKRVAA